MSPTDAPCPGGRDCPHIDAERIADDAAEKAVARTFALLGVNVASPSEVEEFRRDLRFSNFLRRHSDKAIGAVIVAAALGLLGLIYAGAQWVLHGGPKA
jgi:hypothetical protein